MVLRRVAGVQFWLGDGICNIFIQKLRRMSGKGFTVVYFKESCKIQVVSLALLLLQGLGKWCIEKYYRYRRRWLKVAVENIGITMSSTLKALALHQSVGYAQHTMPELFRMGGIKSLVQKLNLVV